MATGPVAEPTPEAFERLYRRHVDDVYRYALAMVRDPAEAEDLTQTTFLRAWRAFRDGTTPRTPQNWFLRIAHNVLRTHFRDRARRPREVELPDAVEAAVPGGPSAADVLDALAALPVTQREAIVMRELEGRSYAEIAEILGVSRSAVETLIFRARRSLRVRRSDLRRLGAVQVPASVASFVRERGVVETVGAVVGSAGVVKAAAVVAAGVVAVGVGKEAGEAVGEPPSAAPAVSADVRPKLRPAATVKRHEGVLPRAAPAPQAAPGASVPERPAKAAPPPRRPTAGPAVPSATPSASPPRRPPVEPADQAPAAPAARPDPPIVERVEEIVEGDGAGALPALPADAPVEAPEVPPVLEEPLPEEPALPDVSALPDVPALPEETPLPSLP